jgi:uncharacterized protein YjbJ (UPF0337 family)
MAQENETETEGSGGLKERVSGALQKVIGEIEEVGGALTGDPTTQAEGQFNVEVGEIREELQHADREDDKER